MKKLLMILAIGTTMVSCSKLHLPDNSSSSTSSSQTGEDHTGTPPQAVAAAFTANFGNTAVQQWKLRSDGTWTAHFMKDGVAWEATFNTAGTLLKSERSK